MSSTSTMLRGLTLGLGLLVATAVAAQETPVGKVTIESKSVAVGIGVSWGDNGLSVADVGLGRVSATGDVYHLKKLSDFSGKYVAAQASGAVGGGAGVVAMRNQNGVVMQLSGTETGIQFTLAGKGVDVKLKN